MGLNKNYEVALQFALSMGFVAVDYHKNWSGFDVYIVQHPGDALIIGFPNFILVKDGIARKSELSELGEIMDINFYPSDTTESL